MNKSINKTELIHIRIEPEVKVQSENIFKRLGVNTSYAVSMFLNQVILILNICLNLFSFY